MTTEPRPQSYSFLKKKTSSFPAMRCSAFSHFPPPFLSPLLFEAIIVHSFVSLSDSYPG